MSRFRLLAAVTVIAALALAGVATAKVTKITGGTTSITLSAAASNVMSANHLTVTPLGSATAAGSTLTFPIAHGRVNAKLHGFVASRGGFALSNGTRTVRVRRLTVAASRAGVSVFALVPRLAGRRCHVGGVRRRVHCQLASHGRVARIARVTGASVNGTSATGTIRLTGVSAAVINALAGKHVVDAGAAIGTGTISATIG
jgi:hypothetical protein